MANKKTLKDYFNDIIVLAQENDRPDLVAFCEDRIDKLSKKSGGSKKPTKTQVENESVKETIVDILTENGTPMSATAIATDPRLGVSNQKVSSLLTQLRKDGIVERIEDKGRAYFTIPSASDEEVEE